MQIIVSRNCQSSMSSVLANRPATGLQLSYTRDLCVLQARGPTTPDSYEIMLLGSDIIRWFVIASRGDSSRIKPDVILFAHKSPHMGNQHHGHSHVVHYQPTITRQQNTKEAVEETIDIIAVYTSVLVRVLLPSSQCHSFLCDTVVCISCKVEHLTLVSLG